MPLRRRTTGKNGTSESVDNYLKAILSLGGAEGGRVTSKALADRLSVAPASVTNMLQKLALSGDTFVKYERHRGVELSASGRLRALEVLRHHRLIETFLYEVLDYPLEEVHEEAERLEHFISERFEERIAAKLGHPRIDPHGHSIPSLEGEMPRQQSVPLSDVDAPASVVVESLSDRDSGVLRLFQSYGIKPAVRLRVTKRAIEGSWVRVGRSRAEVELSREVADDIRVVAESVPAGAAAK